MDRPVFPSAVLNSRISSGRYGMAADAIHFHKIHAPARVQRRNGIVVCLRARFGCVNSKVIRIPRTRFFRVRRIQRVIARACDREICFHGFLRNAAKNVNPKLQVKRM